MYVRRDYLTDAISRNRTLCDNNKIVTLIIHLSKISYRIYPIYLHINKFDNYVLFLFEFLSLFYHRYVISTCIS